MNEINNKFLLGDDKFMPEMHLKQPGDFKDLARRTYSDKLLRDKAFNIAKNHKYDGYQRGLASMVYKFFDKKSKGSGFNISSESHEELAEELRKPVIKKN